MEDKKIVEMTLDELKKVVGGQGTEYGGQGTEYGGEGGNEISTYHCTQCGGTSFHVWRESFMTLDYYITCQDCGDTRFFSSH